MKIATAYEAPSQAEPGEVTLCRAIFWDAETRLYFKPEDYPTDHEICAAYYEAVDWFLNRNPNPNCFFTYEVICQVLNLECPERIREIIFKKAQVHKNCRRKTGTGSLQKCGNTWWMSYPIGLNQRAQENTHCDTRVAALRVMKAAIKASRYAPEKKHHEKKPQLEAAL
jgi:hypothetical protein